MKFLIRIMLLIMISITALYSQSNFNDPVTNSVSLNCKVVKPLSVTPTSSGDYLNWPTIPVGSKYILNSNPDQDADWKSIFTFTGEPNYPIQLSVERQMNIDNVEISYRFKGTNNPYLGSSSVPVVNFVDNSLNVVLSDAGKYYLHLVYDWVWAKQNATQGVKSFTQIIKANYLGI